jgi:hypothetical protein
MNEEPMPGTSAADQELDRRWRRESPEEPSSSTDARIRAAARDAIASSARSGTGTARDSSRWTRFVPLAAAASVALLAVGLVRLIPREEYEAVPTQELARPREARGAVPAAQSKQDWAPSDTERPAGDQLYAEPSAPESRDEAEATAARARGREPAPDSDTTLGQAAEAVAAEEVRGAARAEATVNDQASIEQAAKASEQASEAQAPATAVAPAGIPTAAAPPASRRMDSALPSAVSALPATLAVRVQNDAARRTGLDPASIRIVAVDAVAWMDASLGCEPAGASVPEARVPGYVVTVDADGTTLRYHTDGRDRVRVCEGE